MSDSNKAVLRRWFEEVWNQGCEATVDELFAADAVAHGLGDNEAPVSGPEEFKRFAAGIRGGIPDVHIRIDEMHADGDFVTVRLTLTGTHTGDGLGVAATGSRVAIKGIVIARVANGQIVEGWNSYDQLGLLRQIGALPASA